ncbi:hypothetical protein [Marinobacter sp. W-8]|uniref:hypothetical protein n=1 Tax=Marinobacter sp. W-8 TaxID=3369658 RepID=UPI0037C9E030
MANGKVWIDGRVVPIFRQLQTKLGGSAPFLNVYEGGRPVGPASIHKPTLYPELNIPAGSGGDWGEVARGIAHLISAIDGVPELRAASNADTELAIAQQLNSELQTIAAAKENLQPKPLWTRGGPDALLSMILEPCPGISTAQTRFRLLQLHRLVLDGHPEAQRALDVAREALPEEGFEAESVFNAIVEEDLRHPAGKAMAAAALFEYLDLDPGQFYLQSSQYVDGVFDDRSLGYHPAIKNAQVEFDSLRPTPGCWLKCQLPFALPILEGVYKSDDLILLVRHTRVISSRASWKASQGMRLDSMMNPSGLYAQSVVELWLPGNLAIDFALPPGDEQYKNIHTYPEAIKGAVRKLNEFIVGLRADTGRSDIPEVIPGDLNQLAFKQFDSKGNLTRDIPMLNLELVRVSAGAPHLNEEVLLKPFEVQYPGFARELLESAKFHVSAYSVRRAVIDFAGAYEAFIAEVVSPRIGEVRENTKDQFLRRYGDKLSAEVRAEVEKVTLAPNQDPDRVPPIHRQLDVYKKMGLKPDFGRKHLSAIRKVMDVRNDAAHGRVISHEVLSDIIAGIGALECLMQEWPGNNVKEREL